MRTFSESDFIESYNTTTKLNIKEDFKFSEKKIKKDIINDKKGYFKGQKQLPGNFNIYTSSTTIWRFGR
jgi:hypothetical protein